MPSDTKRTTFAPFLFSWSVAQFPGYAFHWRFVERARGKYSYFSGERVPPFGEKNDPGWLLEKTEQDFRWDAAVRCRRLKEATSRCISKMARRGRSHSLRILQDGI